MLRVSEILINETRKQMEFHKRNASGQASQSLIEEVYDGGVRILGVDYFDNIFNGVPANSDLTLVELNEWAKIKQARYNVGIGGKAAWRNILLGDAWINSQPEKLNIDKKVLASKQKEIDVEVQKIIDKRITEWI